VFVSEHGWFRFGNFPDKPNADYPVYSRMDLVTLTIATGKLEIRCNAALTEEDRTSAIEKLNRLTQAHPEINRLYVDIERDEDLDHPSYITKGLLEIDGPNLLASVADENALKAVEFLVENFDRQLRRRRRLASAQSARAAGSARVEVAHGALR
jgi:ribosome-associated translation inhibitor RaiA